MQTRQDFSKWSDVELIEYRKLLRQREKYLRALVFEGTRPISGINEELARRCVQRGWEMKGYREDADA